MDVFTSFMKHIIKNKISSILKCKSDYLWSNVNMDIVHWLRLLNHSIIRVCKSIKKRPYQVENIKPFIKSIFTSLSEIFTIENKDIDNFLKHKEFGLLQNYCDDLVYIRLRSHFLVSNILSPQNFIEWMTCNYEIFSMMTFQQESYESEDDVYYTQTDDDDDAYYTQSD